MSCPRPAARVPRDASRSARWSRRLAVTSALVCSVIRLWSRARSSSGADPVSIFRLRSRMIPTKKGADPAGRSARETESSMVKSRPFLWTASNRPVRLRAAGRVSRR